jgi:hypothetical protein
MKRLATALVGLLVASLVAAASEDSVPAGWKEVKGGYKDSAYVVRYPANGKVSNDQASIVDPQFGQIRIFRSLCECPDGSLMATSQIILPPKLVKAPPKVRQNLFRDMFLKEVDGTLVEEKKTMLGTMAGRDYVLDTPKGAARFIMLGTGVQIFRVAFVGKKDQLDAKDTQTFFDSFKRTPQSAETAVPKKDE